MVPFFHTLGVGTATLARINPQQLLFMKSAPKSEQFPQSKLELALPIKLLRLFSTLFNIFCGGSFTCCTVFIKQYIVVDLPVLLLPLPLPNIPAVLLLPLLLPFPSTATPV